MEWIVAWIIKTAFFLWPHIGTPILSPESVTAIATCILAGGIGVAIWQIIVTRRASTKSTNAQIAVELFERLRSDETKKTLRFIYQLGPESIANLNGSELRNIDGMLDKFELLGLLVDQDIINEQLAIEAYAGPPALRCWYRLGEYIYKERKKRGFFLKNYEKFTLRTCNYFKTKKTRVSFYSESGGIEIEDLAMLLTSEEFKYSPRSLDEKIKREEPAK